MAASTITAIGTAPAALKAGFGMASGASASPAVTPASPATRHSRRQLPSPPALNPRFTQWSRGRRTRTSFDPNGGAMTTNRERRRRGARQRASGQQSKQNQLDRRRADMQAAEGHAGSIPRGNQTTEHDNIGQRRHEWERLLGH
jgi:hypothetical protein